MEVNPYAPPQTDIGISAPASDVDHIRQEHLKTESNIRTGGVLFVIGAVITMFTGYAIATAPPALHQDQPPVVGYILLGLGFLQGFVGVNMFRLRAWARIPAIIMCVLSLAAFPVGTLISIIILINLVKAKGKTVMTEEYRQIMTQTRHVAKKRKTSKAAWTLLFILLGILAFSLYLGFATRN